MYQRQYRWDIGACEQLLADIRAVADSDERHMHFIGSVLSSLSIDGESAELVLIDGQQRITTLMLLIAALHHTVKADRSRPRRRACERVLVRAADPARTKLRPHRAWAQVFESVVLDRRTAGGELRESRFDDNYAFFRSQISPEEAPQIWGGLQKLEHVAITLGMGANAQQIFESLNSTGEPLRDHELIHNYVLMGLSHAEQSEIEDSFWVPIEQNTGESIGSFWRHYLVMITGREVAVAGERGVYDAFRQRVPAPRPREPARSCLGMEGVLGDLPRAAGSCARARPGDRAPAGVREHRRTRHVPARHAGVPRSRARQGGPADAASRTLEYVQSLLLRRTVVGVGNDRLVARLCRAAKDGQDSLERAISRITPSDERVRVALRYGDLPHAAYVLGRLAGVDTLADLEVEHIFPLAPSDAWSGDGEREWADVQRGRAEQPSRAREDARQSHAARGAARGARGSTASFADKRAAYAKSHIPLTSELAAMHPWGTAASPRAPRS